MIHILENIQDRLAGLCVLVRARSRLWILVRDIHELIYKQGPKVWTEK